jgi:hypothetical protein
MIYKTTKENFECFKQSVICWQKLFGLTDYRIEVEHNKLQRQDALAHISCDIDERWAVITLNIKWPFKPNGLGLEKSAFHEICHLLTAEMDKLGKERYSTLDEINRANEAFVSRMENFYEDFIYPKMKNGHLKKNAH